MFMHCTTTGKSLWCHSTWYYTGVWPGTGLQQYPVTGSNKLNWFYICWKQQNTLVRGSHCATSIPASGARDGKAERFVTCCRHIKKKSASPQSFPYWVKVDSTRKWQLRYSLALLTSIITWALESSSFREEGWGKLCSASVEDFFGSQRKQKRQINNLP